MSLAIARHNFQVLKKQEPEAEPEPGCNCTGRCVPCPLNGACLVNKLVYKATVTEDNNTVNTYTGLTSRKFKDRFYGHRSTFMNRNHPNPTTLSTHVWDLKEKNRNFEVNWSVIDRANAFDPVTRKCRLCLKEKHYLIFQPTGATLNQRSELFSTCRHRLRDTLANP
jgi:hypothetical protein